MAIHELPHAELREVAVNEIAVDQTSQTERPSQYGPDLPDQPSLDDPVALRFGAWANPLGRLKWYISKISMDVLRWKDGRRHRTEVGFIKLAVDELYDMDGQPVPMVALFLTNNATGSTDADQQPVAIFTRRGIRFMAPVSCEAGCSCGSSGGSGGPVTRFYTDHGKFMINWQDDTGLPSGIVYDMQSGTPVAVGRVPIEFF